MRPARGHHGCHPVTLRHAISVGLGLFIALIGLADAGIIVAGNGTLVGLGDVTSPAFIVGIVSIVVTVALASRQRPRARCSSASSSPCSPAFRWASRQAPTGIVAPLNLSTFGAPFAATADGTLAIVKVLTDPMLLIVAFSLLMSDFFDTMGTAMAVAKQGEFLTEDGNVEDIRPILIVDSVAAAAGGFMGVSSITTFVESTSGAADGGRSGLTSVTTGVLFILAAFFSPIVTVVSSAATCGALVYVGYLMMTEVTEIDWTDVSQGFPAFMIAARRVLHLLHLRWHWPGLHRLCHRRRLHRQGPRDQAAHVDRCPCVPRLLLRSVSAQAISNQQSAGPHKRLRAFLIVGRQLCSLLDHGHC